MTMSAAILRLAESAPFNIPMILYPHLHRDLLRPIYGHGFRGSGHFIQVMPSQYGSGIVDRVKAVGSALWGSAKNVGKALFGDISQLGKHAISQGLEGLRNTGAELLENAKTVGSEGLAAITGKSDRSLRDVLSSGASELLETGRRAGSRARDMGADLLKSSKQALHHAAAKATERDGALGELLGAERTRALGNAAQSVLARLPAAGRAAPRDVFEDDEVLGDLFGNGVRQRARAAARQLRGKGLIPMRLV